MELSDSHPSRLRVLAVLGLAVVAAIACFMVARSTGEDLNAARATGQAAGTRSGAIAGTAVGLAVGKRESFSAAYRRSYVAAYKRAYGEVAVTLGSPGKIKVKVPRP